MKTLDLYIFIKEKIFMARILSKRCLCNRNQGGDDSNTSRVSDPLGFLIKK